MTLLEKLRSEANLALRRYQEAAPALKGRCLEEYRRAYEVYRRQKLIVEETPQNLAGQRFEQNMERSHATRGSP